MKITEYYIVSESNASALTVRVDKWIKLGWQPYGAICSFNGEICQPMVKIETEENSFGVVR